MGFASSTAWREDRPCRKEDCDNIRESLVNAEVSLDSVSLICIEQELEAWLIADGRALSEFLSTPTRAVKIKGKKKPDQGNPKTLLTKYCKENGKGIYTDYLHAEKIVKLIPDFQKLRRSISFARFHLKVTGKEL